MGLDQAAQLQKLETDVTYACLCRKIASPSASGYNGWASGYPKTSSSELCAIANTTNSSPAYDWTNTNCIRQLVFMCRIVRECPLPNLPAR